MTLRGHTVAVKQLPDGLTLKQGRSFFRELESYMNLDRPWIVLDCSRLRQVDRRVIHLLLCCLEEAMKRNGDVKLAAMPPEAEAILELTGVKSLFEIFATNADALDSFHRTSGNTAQHASTCSCPHHVSEGAASQLPESRSSAREV
jgi:anti-anti-sigma regulatory factor